MAVTRVELPFGIQMVNPVPVVARMYNLADSIYTGTAQANAEIPQAIRYKGMWVYIDVAGQATLYWYRDGVADVDLVPFLDYVGGGEANTSSNVGAGEGLALPKVGVDLPFKSLTAGVNITLTATADEIEIAAAGGAAGEVNTGANVGGGAYEWFRDKTGVTLNFKTFAQGSGMVITELSDVITFEATGEANTTINVGAGAGLAKPKIGTQLPFKSIIAGTNITIVENTDDIVINAAGGGGSGEVNDGANLGLGAQVFAQKNGLNLEFRTLIAGTNVSIVQNTETIEISATDTGEDNDGANVGGGAEVFRDKTGVDLNFRTFVAGANIAVNQVGDTIEIVNTAAAGGEANTSSNAGGGLGLALPKLGVDLPFKSLIAGANVILTDNGNDITIAAAGGGGGPSGEANTSSNQGGQFEWALAKNGVDLPFRTAEAGSNINLSYGTDTIIIEATNVGEVNTMANIGTGAGVYAQKVGSQFELRSLVGNGDVVVTELADSITIAFTETGEANTTSNVGTGTGLAKPKSGVDFPFKTLLAGPNISIVPATNEITISATNVGESNTMSNLGLGAEIFAQKVGVDFQQRSLTEGTGITLVQSATEIEISAEATDGVNLGSGAEVFESKVSPNLRFRTLTAGTGIFLQQNANDIVITNNATGEANTSSNAGTGAGLALPKNVFDLPFKSIKAGTNITIIENPEDIEIIAASAGEANTASNLGAGQGLFAQKVGVDLQFKSIIAGTNITISQTGTDITINAAGGGGGPAGEANTSSNVGIGLELALPKNGVDLPFRTLSAGSNVSLVYSGSSEEIVISATDTGEDNTASNLGTGEGVFAQKVAQDLQFKSLVAGTLVTLTPSANEILIDVAATGETNTASNVGGGAESFLQKVGVDLQFRTIVAGANVTVTELADTIQIASTDTGEDNLGANVGVGDAGVFRDKTGVTLNFRRLVAGSNIDITENADTINIAATGLGETNTMSNIGGFAEVFAQKNGVDFELRTLQAGSNIQITQNLDNLLIDAINVGEVNTTSNAGVGAGLALPKAGVDFPFKSLIGGTNVTLGIGSDEITINASSAVTGGTNLGGGSQVFKQLTGTTFEFRTLTAGNNITLNQSATEIEIVADDGEVNTMSNIGGGSRVFAQKNGVDFELRTLVGSGAASVTEVGDTIEISVTPASGEANTSSNAGATGIGLALPKVGVDLPFKRLFAGSNIILTDQGNYVQIDGVAAGGGESNVGSNIGGGTYEWYAGKSGVALQFKTLEAGTNVSIVENANVLTISSTDTGEVNTASNIGTGSNVYKEKVGSDLRFRRINGGGDITVTQNTNDITIDFTETGEANTTSNAGGGFPLALPKNVLDFPFRTLLAGTNIQITQQSNTLTLSATGVGENNTSSNQGGGIGLALPKSGVDLPFKTLAAGSLITITELNNVLTFATTAQNNTASNLGGGSQVYKQKVGSNFEFRTLVGGTNVDLVQSGTEITINSTDTGEANTMINLGGVSTEGVFFQKSGVQFQMKSLKAGNNVTLSSTNNEITISSTDTGEANTGANVGTGSNVFRDKTGSTLNFRRLQGGSNITVTQQSNDIVIAATGLGEINDGLNVGSQAEVFKEKSNLDLVFRTLEAGPSGNVSITQLANTIQIDSINTGEVNTAVSLGGTADVYKQKVAAEFEFRGITGGTNVTITENPNEIVISATDTGEVNSGVNVGSTNYQVFKQKSGDDLQFRSIVAGSNVTMSYAGAGNNDIQINAPNAQRNEGQNLGSTGSRVYAGMNVNNLTFRRIIGGTNITVTEATNDITIDVTNVGQTNTMTNVGVGTGEVYKQTAGVEFQLRTLRSLDPELTISTVSNEVNFALSGLVTSLSFAWAEFIMTVPANAGSTMTLGANPTDDPSFTSGDATADPNAASGLPTFGTNLAQFYGAGRKLFINGVLQRKGHNYNWVSNTSVTFVQPLSLDSVIRIETLTATIN